MKKRTGRLILFLTMVALITGVTSYGVKAGSKGGEKPYELTVAFQTYGSTPSDMQLVENAINKIALKKINVKVKFVPISMGAWIQQMQLMLASNEKLDLTYVTQETMTSAISKQQLLPMDNLLHKYGKDIAKALGPYLKACSIRGKIYMVTSIRDLATSYGIAIKKEVVDKYKIDITKIKTYDDVEAFLKTVKTHEPNTTPLVPCNTLNSVVTEIVTYDSLNNNMTGVLLNRGLDNLKVVNWFETKEYAKQLKMVRRWYTSGYILKDAATNKESAQNLVKAGLGVAFLCHNKPGFDQQQTNLCGTPMVSATILPALATTSYIQLFGWSIPRNAQKPEKSMQFLNLMYSDKDIVNLLDWGIEGKHYVKVKDNIIGYPPGVDAKTTGYGLNRGWMFGNQFLSHVWQGNPPDLWKQLDRFNKTAIKSKALGFAYDPTAVKTEIAAITNVCNQYQPGLETGTLDPQERLPEFISKLKAAGIDKIIADKQRQLDEWAKAHKIK
jgi:putative aldouronate transport system substrate-binding protein